MRWIAAGTVVLAATTGLVIEARGQNRPSSRDRPIEAGSSTTRAEGEAPLSPEASSARLATLERLHALGDPADAARDKPKDKAAEARAKVLREIYQERLRLIVEWDKASQAARGDDRPSASPEAESAELKATIESAKAALAQAAKNPTSLLPEAFRSPSASVAESALTEMNEAIRRAQETVEDLGKGLESLTVASGRKDSPTVSAAKAEREDSRKKVAALAPRRDQLQAALAKAASLEARELARERLANLEWEGKVEAERLRQVDSRLEVEGRRAAMSETRIEAQKLRLELARATLAASNRPIRPGSIAERKS